jgi:heterodisulfide reductase subunit A
MRGSVLVVGAGISGMRASAELLQQGFRVYLLERKPTIGGKMAQLDKMFPSNECATCTQLPKMLELTSNPSMTILAFAELLEVKGSAGEFKVRIRKQPRFVDPAKCTACTDCFPACPVGGIPMEFNLGRGASKAISFYSPFPPRKALINPTKCAYLVEGKCGTGPRPPCVEACQPGAIDFSQKPQEVEISAGAIIVATGAEEQTGEALARYGKGRLANVLTSLEFERLLSGLGPTGGIVRRDDKKEPRRLAWIISKDSSPVAFMSAAAEALGVLERNPKAEVCVFYEEERTDGKGYGAFYRSVKDRGVKYVQAPSLQVAASGGGNLLLSTPQESFEAEMLVLSAPLAPAADARQLAASLGVQLDERGFFCQPGEGHPILTSREGIFVCGTAQGPKGIGESVIQACAAASHAAALLAAARGSELAPAPKKKLLPVDPGDEAKVAAIICRCGLNIGGLLNMDELVQYTSSLPAVKRVEVTPFGCDGVKLKELAGSGSFNRILMGACSPRTHEDLFQLHTESGGLNRYLMEIVNLRNQCTWVHSKDKAEATSKAKILMKMGVARAEQLQPLDEMGISITQRCLVIGGTPSGIACALKLAGMGFEVHLLESEADLEKVEGNDEAFAKTLLPGLRADERIKLHTQSWVGEIEGYIGNYRVRVTKQGTEEWKEVGAIVVASARQMRVCSNGAGYEDQLALKRSEDQKFIPSLGILNPLDFNTDGVFLCGSARAELGVKEAVVDGEAAASRVAGIISRTQMLKAPTISTVIDENCDGCAYCVEPCPSRAITLLEYRLRQEVKKTVEVNEAVCKGCGICMATCPKKGIFVRHFKPEYFQAMVKAALEVN